METFCTAERCFATFKRVAGEGLGPAALNAAILRRVLAGERQKVAAVELRRAPSTISVYCRSCLEYMGVRDSASRAPLLLMLAAHASLGAELGAVRSFSNDSGEVLSAERPDNDLPSCLSAAEKCVVRMMVEGGSHVNMAEQRACSHRTVANQLAAVFRKLHVSGRGELVASLVRRRSEALVRQRATPVEPLRIMAGG
ncbi:MAG TPA: LuxR C-terminal-related transcriptional regulator [Polyangiaceae bacterium]|nr:LuxR C-terminal-related transcriptional regulator [Polyangiaceae bacterium]